jgi:hypothetical protein
VSHLIDHFVVKFKIYDLLQIMLTAQGRNASYLFFVTNFENDHVQPKIKLAVGIVLLANQISLLAAE